MNQMNEWDGENFTSQQSSIISCLSLVGGFDPRDENLESQLNSQSLLNYQAVLKEKKMQNVLKRKNVYLEGFQVKG